MLREFTTFEDAKTGLHDRLKELAVHPAIDVDPGKILIEFSPRYRRVQASCKKRTNKLLGTHWIITFNLHALMANLDNPEELDHTCVHEMAHVAAPNHGPNFRRVCRALGMPEERIGAKKSKLKSPEAKEIFVCLRCGTTKRTLRKHTDRLKRCDYCGYHYDSKLKRVDKSRTMAMFPVTDKERVKKLAIVTSGERHEQTRWLPWKEYAQYVKDGGELPVLAWWQAALEHGIYTIPAKYQDKDWAAGGLVSGSTPVAALKTK